MNYSEMTDFEDALAAPRDVVFKFKWEKSGGNESGSRLVFGTLFGNGWIVIL